MKSIISLSSIALISFANAAPALASRQISENLANYQGKTARTEIAFRLGDILKTVKEVKETVRTVTDTAGEVTEFLNEQEKRELEMELKRAQIEAYKQRQAEIANARKIATETQKQEAQQQVSHFNTLQPTKKKQYFEQKKTSADATSLVFLGLLGAALLGGDDSNSSGATSNNGCPPGTTQRIVNGSWFCT